MMDRVVGSFNLRGAPAEQRARGELLLAGTLFGLVVSLVTGIGFLLVGMVGQAEVCFAGLPACLLGPLMLRLGRSVEAAAHVTLGLLTAGYAAASVASGDLSHLGWLGIIPIGALLLFDIKPALIWLGAVSATILCVGAWVLRHPEQLQLAPMGVLLMRLVIFTVTAFGLTSFFARARLHALRSLEDARDEANRANGLKSEFLASFSHEIRTPLNGVLGTTDALLASNLPPDAHEQLLIIQRSGSSLLRTINDVLELSRIEAGRLDLFPVTTDLPQLLNEVLDLFRARATSRGLSLSLVLEEGHPRHVMVDDLRLRQVVQNLVGNAVKFTVTGEVRLRLAASPAAGGRVLTRISVEDTGPGIAPAAASRLFSVFTQARPRIDRADGTGLGLAISKQFIELMGGKLGVDTQPGRGSVFTIELTVPLSEQALRLPSPVSAEVAKPARHLKVLVADDNEINLKVAVALLTRLGHETVVARDGAQALAAVAEHQPDVVLMDCHMPGMDGLEATRQLRASGDHRPVVAVTASVYGEDRERALAAGMNHFVGKPISLHALQTALDEVTVGPAPLTAQPMPTHAPRVLVVDDDPHVRRMAVRLLRAEGFEVSDAADVEAALILFERAVPDCLLVDNVLGGTEDGMHFAERLCRRRSGLRVVVTSGRTPSEEQLASLAASGGRFLAKPYNRQGLVASLRPT